jgi:iron-sulfur cluster repair protein YtfE (RIC family)
MDLNLLEELERQHRMVEELLTDLEAAEEADAQQTLIAELGSALAEHMEIEETQVYPRLAELEAELGEEAEVEHRLAREGLAKLESLVGQPGFGAAVAMLRAGIEHHVEDEEETAFPMLRQAEGGEQGGDGARSAGNGDAGEQSKAELYERAKELNIEGRGSMSKEELARAVERGS